MIGPCAKATVTCTLVTPEGEHIVGTNYCRNAQNVCPRQPGEGYEKCRSVCDQAGHAEIVAVALAGEKAKGARAYLQGHLCLPDVSGGSFRGWGNQSVSRYRTRSRRSMTSPQYAGFPSSSFESAPNFTGAAASLDGIDAGLDGSEVRRPSVLRPELGEHECRSSDVVHVISYSGLDDYRDRRGEPAFNHGERIA